MLFKPQSTKPTSELNPKRQMSQDAANWETLQTLFHLVEQTPPEERERVLGDHCSDPKLRRRVMAMIAGLDAVEGTRTAPIVERIGPYSLIRLLGSGGMGFVYLVERVQGGAPKRLALKVLSPHAGGPSFIERFHREQHILGSLDHPNITRMLDAGTSESGQPYLVMEYIQGVHLDDYCDQHTLDIRARIQLFLQACEAVAFAHRNLVVHLDLKPSNILVKEDGSVKLLDFGTSKLIQTDTYLTTTVLATPAFASPEQLRNEPVTTACDVYSLGVILFGLLSGSRPGGNAPVAVMLERAMREQEPQRLTTAVTKDGAEHCGLTLPRMHAMLKGDLENIVAKCLRSRPKDRYSSVDILMDDVRRYLDNRPVTARAQTATYKLGKFVRRNRKGVAAATIAFLLLSASLGYAEWRQQQALKEGRRAERETAAANAVKTFLDEDIIRAASPYMKTSPQDVTVREAIERGADKAVGRFKDQPEIEGEFHSTLGDLYKQLNQYGKAEIQYRTAVPLLTNTLGERAAKTRDAQYAWASVLTRQSKYDEAYALLQHLETLREPGDSNDAQLSAVRDEAWGRYYYQKHEWQKEERFDLQGISDYQRWQPGDLTGLAMRQTSLAVLYVTSGRLDDADRVARQVVTELEVHGNNRTLGYGTAMSVLGRTEYFRRDYSHAEPDSMKAYTLLKTVEGDQSLRALDALYILDRLQLDTGRYAEALANARRIHATYAAVLGEHSDSAYDFLYLLGHNEYLAGMREQGIRDMEAGLTGTGGLDSKAKNVLEKYLLASDYLDFGMARLEAARAIVDHQIDVESLHHVQPDRDWPARFDALRGQIAYYDRDKARARQLLEPAIAQMIAMKSPQFEIERAQRCLMKINQTHPAAR